MRPDTKTILASVLALAAALLAADAAAQAYPEKPIRFIVGPGPDSLARVFGQKMTEAWGQPVIVEQRGGGGGTISAEAVAKAPPDGYTLLLATGTHTINPSVYKTSYDIVRDFAPVTLIGSTPFVLAVHPSVPVHSVAELIALAKSKPGKLNYGSGGSGTPPHLATEMLKVMAGIDMVHVPYKTVPAAITDLVAGQIQVMFTVGPAGLPQIRAGRIRGLAVSTAKRSAFAPELPTVAESGLPGYDVFGWNGVLVPAGTPKAIIAKLHDAIVGAMKEPAVRERMAGFGFEPVGNTPEEFGEFVKTDIARWAKVVKQSGAKAE
ncbi:MAG TPA: tripartite tricarboxylate transporter substrate binding protein [Burkholderiales bacterium]